MVKKLRDFYTEKLPWYVKNKFVLTFAALFTWVLLFDNFDLFTVMKMRYEIGQKEAEINKIQDLIEADQKHFQELTSDPELLEKFAREQYLMKKENEDIFIILAKEEK